MPTSRRVLREIIKSEEAKCNLTRKKRAKIIGIAMARYSIKGFSEEFNIAPLYIYCTTILSSLSKNKYKIAKLKKGNYLNALRSISALIAELCRNINRRAIVCCKYAP